MYVRSTFNDKRAFVWIPPAFGFPLRGLTSFCGIHSIERIQSLSREIGIELNPVAGIQPVEAGCASSLFIEEPKTIDRIIRYIELKFEAERPPPPRVVRQHLLMAAEESGEYF